MANKSINNYFINQPCGPVHLLQAFQVVKVQSLTQQPPVHVLVSVKEGQVCPLHELCIVTLLVLLCVPCFSQLASHFPHDPQLLTWQLTGQHLQWTEKSNDKLLSKIKSNYKT